MKASTFQAALTTRELKVKPTSANVAGLGSLISLLTRLSRHHPHPPLLPQATSFSGQIAQLLTKSKYRRGCSGRIDGYGRIFLPASQPLQCVLVVEAASAPAGRRVAIAFGKAQTKASAALP